MHLGAAKFHYTFIRKIVHLLLSHLGHIPAYSCPFRQIVREARGHLSGFEIVSCLRCGTSSGRIGKMLESPFYVTFKTDYFDDEWVFSFFFFLVGYCIDIFKRCLCGTCDGRPCYFFIVFFMYVHMYMKEIILRARTSIVTILTLISSSVGRLFTVLSGVIAESARYANFSYLPT